MGYRPSCKFCCKNFFYDIHNHILNNHKVFSQNNRSKINAYERLRRKTDLYFKIACNLRSRTNSASKSQNVRKTNKTFDLIGFSLDFFKKWILHQLYGEMTLEIYDEI